jgi:hypothetical protein
VAPLSASLVMMPVDSPRSSAYSRIVLSGAPSRTPRSADADCPTTLLFVFWPVTMAVMAAAESVTNRDALDVSDKPMFGMRCRYSFRGAP